MMSHEVNNVMIPNKSKYFAYPYNPYTGTTGTAAAAIRLLIELYEAVLLLLFFATTLRICDSTTSSAVSPVSVHNHTAVCSTQEITETDNNNSRKSDLRAKSDNSS